MRPSLIFATALAPPSTTYLLVTNRPSSATKKPVPVRRSFPELSNTETRITAGLTCSNTLRKSAAGFSLGWGRAVAAGISALGAVVLEAICDAGVGKVGLSACDFGFELHRAIATTMPSKAKKKTTRNLFMRLYFFQQHQNPKAQAPRDENSP